jgi:hypothetical protein
MYAGLGATTWVSKKVRAATPKTSKKERIALPIMYPKSPKAFLEISSCVKSLSKRLLLKLLFEFLRWSLKRLSVDAKPSTQKAEARVDT